MKVCVLPLTFSFYFPLNRVVFWGAWALNGVSIFICLNLKNGQELKLRVAHTQPKFMGVPPRGGGGVDKYIRVW